MKKVILIIILLIIATGVAFYFGWVNVNPGKFLVAHSTLTGTVNYPLESGKLNWLWQKLIPKSFHLYEIEKEPYKETLDFSFPLPGSEELKEYGSFNLGMRLTIQYSVDFDAAKTLLDLGIIEDFGDYLSQGFQAQIDDTVTGFILENMAKYSLMSQSFDYAALELLREMLKGKITDFAVHYRLKDVQTTLSFSEIPQVETYREALSHYLKYMESLSKLTDERAKKEAEYQLMMDEDDVEIARLKKYGELIAQYPELLKYFYIQKFGEKTRVLVLPQDESTGFPRMLEPAEEAPKKEFVPMEQAPSVEPEIPEEAEGVIEEEEPAPQEGFVEEQQKERWYKYLKFWKYINK